MTKVVHYKKPSSRPEPEFEPAVQVEEIQQIANVDAVKEARVNELVYNIVRSKSFHETPEDTRGMPPWGTFHAMISPKDDIPVSTVAFSPILMAPPGDLSTVYTTLLRLKEAATTLGQTTVPVFFDLGLLTKALEITWSRSDELKGVVPCEGGMHLLMSLFAAIGNLYGDAGLKDLLHESGVFAAGSVQQMLSGRDFDRALYGLKIVDEALNTQLLQQFKKWCTETERPIPEDGLSTLLSNLEKAFSGATDVASIQETMVDLRKEITDNFLPHLEAFRKAGHETSPTFKLWDELLSNVLGPLKLFVSATRNGDWDVHQSAKAEFLPVLFAANRTNYARYLPVLLLQQRRLPATVARAFQDGDFVAKISSGRFNKVWLDYTLESTENKSLKGSGGIIGLTLKGTALARWFLARPITAKYALTFHEASTGLRKTQDKTLQHVTTSAEKRWNTDVERLRAMFEGSFLDPFDLAESPPNLVHIATGAIVPKAIAESLGGALQKGASQAKSFVKERLVKEEDQEKPNKSLYDALPRSNVKTMTDMKKSVKVKAKNVSMNGEVMYLRLLAVNALKKVPLKRVMSFENAPVPLSMFTDTGSMVSCAKSQFMHKLEEMIPGDKITAIASCDAMVFDGHAIIQTLLPPSHATVQKPSFKDMAGKFIDHVMYTAKSVPGNDASEMHIVFDRYFENSIKNRTREKRGHNVGHTYHVLPDVAIPGNWKQFLGVAKNKTALAEYYTKHLSEVGPSLLDQGQAMYISGGKDESTIQVTPDSVVEVQNLQSNQEEADTRIVLHAVVAADHGCDKIVVCSPDTDVLVLLVHHRPAIAAKEIYFLTGHDGKQTSLARFIPVHEIHHILTSPQRNILLTVYCMTGCDTVSSFFGHGKKTAFRILKQRAQAYQQLSSLGTTPVLTREQEMAASKFVGALYGSPETTSLNALRCEKASKSIQAKKLPPTEDSFHLHLLRVVYQLLIWRNSTSPLQELPEVTQFGYVKDHEGSLQAQLMSQSPAAPELLNSLVCDCSTCENNCPCLENNQPCTTVCECEALLPLDQDDNDNCCMNLLTLNALQNVESESDED